MRTGFFIIYIYICLYVNASLHELNFSLHRQKSFPLLLSLRIGAGLMESLLFPVLASKRGRAPTRCTSRGNDSSHDIGTGTEQGMQAMRPGPGFVPRMPRRRSSRICVASAGVWRRLHLRRHPSQAPLQVHFRGWRYLGELLYAPIPQPRQPLSAHPQAHSRLSGNGRSSGSIGRKRKGQGCSSLTSAAPAYVHACGRARRIILVSLSVYRSIEEKTQAFPIASTRTRRTRRKQDIWIGQFPLLHFLGATSSGPLCLGADIARVGWM